MFVARIVSSDYYNHYPIIHREKTKIKGKGGLNFSIVKIKSDYIRFKE